MDKIVPSWLVAFILFWTGSVAFASCLETPNICDSLAKFKDATNCTNPTTENQVICDYAVDTFCMENSTVQGCDGNQRALAVKTKSTVAVPGNLWSSPDSVTQDLTQANRLTKKTFDNAQRCCIGDGSACTEVKNNAVDQGITTPAPADGITGAAAATRDLSLNTFNAQSQLIGVCKARKDVCQIQALSLAKALESKPFFADCGDSCKTADDALTKQANDCAGMQQPKESDATNALNDANKAGQARDEAAAADGKRSGGGSGSGGDIGSMAKTMLPMLEQMMQQQQQQQPQAQDQSAPDCSSDAVVAAPGVCPPKTAAAPTAWAPAQGTGQFAQNRSGGQIDTGNLSDNMVGQPPPQIGGDPGKGGAQKNDTIAMGTPGGPQASGGGGGGGFGAQNRGAGGQLKTNTDILQNERGASAIGGLGGDAGTSGSGGYTYGGGGGRSEPPINYADLLPKGSRLRGLAGGDARIVQIQPKEVNIWSRISEHIRARCSQGLLRDCIP